MTSEQKEKRRKIQEQLEHRSRSNQEQKQQRLLSQDALNALATQEKSAYQRRFACFVCSFYSILFFQVEKYYERRLLMKLNRRNDRNANKRTKHRNCSNEQSTSKTTPHISCIDPINSHNQKN